MPYVLLCHMYTGVYCCMLRAITKERAKLFWKNERKTRNNEKTRKTTKTEGALVRCNTMYNDNFDIWHIIADVLLLQYCTMYNDNFDMTYNSWRSIVHCIPGTRYTKKRSWLDRCMIWVSTKSSISQLVGVYLRNKGEMTLVRMILRVVFVLYQIIYTRAFHGSSPEPRIMPGGYQNLADRVVSEQEMLEISRNG